MPLFQTEVVGYTAEFIWCPAWIQHINRQEVIIFIASIILKLRIFHNLTCTTITTTAAGRSKFFVVWSGCRMIHCFSLNVLSKCYCRHYLAFEQICCGCLQRKMRFLLSNKFFNINWSHCSDAKIIWVCWVSLLIGSSVYLTNELTHAYRRIS